MSLLGKLGQGIKNLWDNYLRPDKFIPLVNRRTRIFDKILAPARALRRMLRRKPRPSRDLPDLLRHHTTEGGGEPGPTPGAAQKKGLRRKQ